MKGGKSNSPAKVDDSQINEHSLRLLDNVKGFQHFVGKIFEAIEQDEKFSKMTAESYEQKKSYMRSRLLEIMFIHTALADQYASLIKDVSEHSPSLLQKQHLESSESTSPPRVTNMLAPTFSTVTGFDVVWQPDGAGLYLSKRKESSHSGAESSMSSVNKPAVPPVSDDALEVHETEGSELPSVDKPAVPVVSDDTLKETKDAPVIDDALQVEETKDSGPESLVSSGNKSAVPQVSDDSLKLEETKDYDSESSMAYVNKPPVAPDPVIIDVLKGEEPKDSDSESSVSSVNISRVSDDTLKVKETQDSDTEFSMPSAAVPPANDESLSTEETKDSDSGSSMSSVNSPLRVSDDALKVKETKDDGSVSSLSSVNKLAVPPAQDDTLKVEETKNSDGKSNVPSVNKSPVPLFNDDVLKVKETKNSDGKSTVPSVNKPPVPLFNDDAPKVKKPKNSVGKSTVSSVDKPPVPLFNDDALKVKESKNSDGKSTVSSVNKPPVPLFNDDAKVKETKDSGCGGSESSTLSVNDPAVPPVNDDALKVEETEDPKALLEKISSLEEKVARMKQKILSLEDENGELKEKETIEEELKASEDIATKLDERAGRVLKQKLCNQSKHDSEITELNMKIQRYLAEISKLKRSHEKKERVWNAVTAQLKIDLKKQSDLVDELNKTMTRKDDQLNTLWKQNISRDDVIQQMSAELESVKSENVELVSAFDKSQKVIDELKLKLVELEKEVQLQKEAMSTTEES